MTLSENLALLLLLVLAQNSVRSSTVKRENNEGVESVGNSSFVLKKSLFGESEEKYLEKEILEELNRLNSRKQREIFDNLEKQHEKFNVSHKSLAFSETENLSPLNVAELKNIRNTIKASSNSNNSSLPAVRNKRTLNFLLLAVARAMGYTLTPSNPDAEWIPRQQPPSAQPCSPPSSSPPPPPPCSPAPPSTPPPCSMPPTAPPCPGSNALMQSPTIPPQQIDANTISYPYRPARTIPLFNFAPLPAGMRVPYPPLFQPPSQQRSPCTPQQPSPPPCGTTPAPPQPCSTPSSPKNPPPCRPTSAPSPSPCGTTPAPSPCNMTPATPSSPCKPTSPPPCGTSPAPSPPPCMTTPAPSPPCAPTPSPSPPPCGTPKPPPCSNPTPPPCGSSSPPPPPPPEPPKKGSILLEYDDPVRIQIFSNDKKYLPASGSIYSGHDDEHKDDWNSQVSPEKNKKDEDFEEMEEEHIEEEEEDYEAPGQLKHYEEEDEKSLANNEEEDESETSLSIVKKPVAQDLQKTHTRRPITSKIKTSVSNGNTKKNEKEDSNHETAEKFQKMTKPKKKKWIRIVKKQRRKSKTDPNSQNSFQIHSSDNFPEASQVAPKYFGKRDSPFGFDSYEKDVSDFSDDPSSHSSEDVTQIDLKKIIVNNKEIKSPELKGYELNFNPYALEPEDQRRKKLEKAVERYVEDYVEKQLGNELIKNTGIPKTTVFEFSPKNGPKIQTITTTVAKTSHNGNNSNFKPQPKRDSYFNAPTRNAHVFNQRSYGENLKRQSNAANYGTFTIHT